MTSAARLEVLRASRPSAPAKPEAPRALPDADAPHLAGLPVGALARVTILAVGDHAGPWLEAVGISVGELVTVLRRAPFGGPLHIRTGSGGEFALCRSLAKSIAVDLWDEALGEAAE